jgi:hypothetical protein
MRPFRIGQGIWSSSIATIILVATLVIALPVQAIVIPLVGDLPPDPGVAGEATIEGIDANNNGVRDDLELAIFASYPDNPGAREILYQSAIAYQTMLTQRTTASVVLDSFGYLAALSPCLTVATGSSSAANDILRPYVLNTYDRSIAYITALETISTVTSLPLKIVTCTALPSYPPLPPGTPSSISVPASSTTVTNTISWGAAIGTVTKYELQQDTSSGFSAPAIAYSGTALSSSVSVIQNGTYYYRVRACNSTGCSNFRTGANSVVVAAPPGVPGSIAVPLTSSSLGQYTISWGPASGTVTATRYELYEAKGGISKSGPLPPNFSTAVLRYSGTSLTVNLGIRSSTYGGLYYYRVRACNNVGCSDYRTGSNGVSVSTLLR